MKHELKRVCKSLVVLVLLGSLLTGCSASKKEVSKETVGKEKTTVKILENRESLCLAPLHIAIINGYFEEEFEKIGQEYELVTSNIATVTEQLSSNKINAGYGLTGSLMQPISNGLDIVFTTGLHTGCTKFYVKQDSGINTLEDLRGKKIGVPSLSDSSTINLKRKLADLGFKVNGDGADIILLAYEMTDLPVALDNGAVEAIGIHDPVATSAEQTYGFRKILDTGLDDKFKEEYCCQAYVSGDLVSENPEGASAYTRAMQKAAAFIEADPYEAAKLQIENGYMPGTVEENAQHNGEILDSFNYNPSVSLGRKTFETAFDDLQVYGDIDKSLSKDEFVKKVYLDLEGVPDTIVYDKETKTFSE